ncbi:hypothetical protein ACJX0J_008807 [Zea mays]
MSTGTMLHDTIYIFSSLHLMITHLLLRKEKKTFALAHILLIDREYDLNHHLYIILWMADIQTTCITIFASIALQNTNTKWIQKIMLILDDKSIALVGNGNKSFLRHKSLGCQCKLLEVKAAIGDRADTWDKVEGKKKKGDCVHNILWYRKEKEKASEYHNAEKFLVWFCLLLLSITTLLSFSFIYLCRFRGVYRLFNMPPDDLNEPCLYFIPHFYNLAYDSEGLYTARSNYLLQSITNQYQCQRGIQNILTGLTGLQLSHGQITDAGMNANLNCYCTTYITWFTVHYEKEYHKQQ